MQSTDVRALTQFNPFSQANTGARPEPARARHSATGYRADVDGIRAIAVLAVLAFHARVPGIRGGFAGVDIFFVLSGYLISGVILARLDAGRFSFTDFYARRIARIFPALILILSASWAMGWWFLFRGEFQSFGKHVFSGATFVSNVTLWREAGYFDTESSTKPLLHLWSLAVEEQYYLGWPIFLAVLWRGRRNKLVYGLGILAALSFVAAMFLSSGRHSVASFYLPVTRMWELIAGSYIAYRELQKRHSHPAGAIHQTRRLLLKGEWLLPWLGLILLLLALTVPSESSSWPGVLTMLPIAGTMLLISVGSDNPVNRMLARPVVVGVGLISYPLYLWHWPLLTFLRLTAGPEPPVALTAIVLALSFALAILTYRLVEVPIRFGGILGKRRSAVLCSSVAVIGVFGLGTWGGYIPSRLATRRNDAIDAARSDWAYTGGGFVGQSRNVDVRRLAGNKADSVLFIGDSHMEQYWPRLKRVVDSAGASAPTINFVTQGGCPFLPGVSKKHFRCSELYDAAMARARNSKAHAIVFSSFWELYVGFRHHGNAQDPEKLVMVGDPRGDAVFRQFESDVSALVHQGKHVYFVLSGPASHQFDPVTMLPNRWSASEPAQTSAFVAEAPLLAATLEVRAELKHVALETGAATIDPFAYLCDGTRCPATSADGLPLYKDDNHMRPEYVRERAGYIDAVLR